MTQVEPDSGAKALMGDEPGKDFLAEVQSRKKARSAFERKKKRLATVPYPQRAAKEASYAGPYYVVEGIRECEKALKDGKRRLIACYRDKRDMPKKYLISGDDPLLEGEKNPDGKDSKKQPKK